MIKFILKRLLAAIPLLFFITFITLLLMHCVPGDYFSQLKMNPLISRDVIALYETKFHLNDTVIMQYVSWLRGIAHGDFGYSFSFQRPVSAVIFSRLYNTLLLSLSAFSLSWCCAIPAGLFAAYRHNTVVDKAISTITYALTSIPSFVLALVVLFLCAQYTSLPLGGAQSIDHEYLSFAGRIGDRLEHLAVPVLILSLYSFGYLYRVVRLHALDSLRSDHIVMLYARGLSHGVVVKHLLRNILNPLVSLFGMELPSLLSGAALIEIITNWPGLGSVMLYAVRSHDVYLIMGNMVMISVVLVAGILLSDIMLAFVDPRIRHV